MRSDPSGTNGWGRRSVPHHAPLGFVLVMALISASTASAFALEIHGPRSVLAGVQVPFAAHLSSVDHTGTVDILLDDRVIASGDVGRSGSLTSMVALPSGRHVISAQLQSRWREQTVSLAVRSWGEPGAPGIISPRPGSLWGKVVDVRAKAGRDTTRLGIFVDGEWVRSVDVIPFQEVVFRDVVIGDRARITIAGRGPGGRVTTDVTIRRLAYPWRDCIVVDKSDFRLYLIKADRLVASYPVAVGAVGMTTPSAVWRIDAKYVTWAGSVYGPRKMRMFRRSGSSGAYRYTYTAYAIHGTDTPTSIGTRASHGCIRLFNADVLKLYPQVPLGTLVLTRD